MLVKEAYDKMFKGTDNYGKEELLARVLPLGTLIKNRKTGLVAEVSRHNFDARLFSINLTKRQNTKHPGEVYPGYFASWMLWTTKCDWEILSDASE